MSPINKRRTDAGILHSGGETDARRYHSAGLLKPAAVEPFTGYRYYDADQIRTAQVIHRLDESLHWYDAAMAELDTAFPPAERTGAPGGHYANELFTEGAGPLTVYRPVRTSRAGGRIEVVRLPPADLAVAVHPGSHNDIDVTYGRLGAWVVEQALTVAGPIHESYVAGLGTPPIPPRGVPRSAGRTSVSPRRATPDLPHATAAGGGTDTAGGGRWTITRLSSRRPW